MEKNSTVKDFLSRIPFIKVTHLGNKTSSLIKIIDDANFDKIAQDCKLNSNFVEDLKKKKIDVIYCGEEYQRTVIALFKPSCLQPNDIRALTEKICNFCKGNDLLTFDIIFPENFNSESIAFFFNSLISNNYAHEIRKNTKFHFISHVNIINKEVNLNDKFVDFKIKSAENKIFAKELCATRANIATTTFFTHFCEEYLNNPLVETHLIIGEELKNQNMNLIYNVGKGSITPPVLMNLYYKGNKDCEDVYAFVGKGITFDTGGLNIKTSSMDMMYFDKSGASVVLSTFRALTQLNLPINVTCTLALAENSISERSYRPSDVLTSLDGLTVEISNTDAEGRLVLGDAITWTQRKYKPKVLFDIATLTGACMMALGKQTAGLFTNCDLLAQKITEIGKKCGEPVWRLPIFEEHRLNVESEVADIRNTGKIPYGGASSAAAFLENFVEKKNQWVHLDIAGPNIDAKNKTTGFGVEIFLNYLYEIATIPK